MSEQYSHHLPPVDPKEEQHGLRAAKLSLTVSIFVFFLKIGAYFLTHSTAVLSDGLESVVNVVAGIMALIVMYYVSQPADEEHPYGHGKMEYFSAAFEGGLIFFAALAILGEAGMALFRGEAPRELALGMVFIFAATLINAALGLYLKKTGKRVLSETLIASGEHILSDVWSTLGVITGLILVKLTGWNWVDPIVALLIGVQLAYAGLKIVRRSISALIDGIDLQSLQTLCEAFNKNRGPGFIDVHLLKTIRSGKFHHIDAHLVVPEYWNVSQAHEWSEEFESKIVSTYPFEGEMALHLDPCKKRFCSICEINDCPIRLSPFKSRREFDVKSMTGNVRVTE
jgi:cation diffusion facilitator family transporter